jgi:uncharacterized tellurite resistance protein B-like protein
MKKNKARFLSLYCMVLADGTVDVRELETLYRIGKDSYGVSPDEINRMVVGAGTSIPEFSSFEDKVELLYQLAEIAWADGKIEDTELNLMRKYAIRFGFIEENVDAIIQYLLDKAEKKTPLKDILTEIKSSKN